jgi:SNF2 family DNA or RNA helicase
MALAKAEQKQDGVGIASHARFKTKPYAHQLTCLEQFGRNESFALLAEMGTGKTWIIINNIADLWASDDLDGVLVLAPNGVHTNWTKIEIPKHMPDWVQYTAAAWYASPNKREKAELEALYKNGIGLRILVMNWEALQTKRGFKEAQDFVRAFRSSMIVADESSRIKNPSALRTKNLMKLRELARWRRIMSGTPITNGPFDAFAQFTFLDPWIFGTQSFFSFKQEYAEVLHDGHPLVEAIKRKNGLRRTPQIIATDSNKRPKYRNLKKLAALIDPVSFRVLKKDCLDLPSKIYKTAFFELTPEQQEVYDKMLLECRLVFQNRETAFNKIVAMQKLAQITSGYYLYPESDEPVRIPGANPKLELLKDRVAEVVEQGKKVIVWARYRVEIEDIVKALGEYDVVQYHGGINKADREEAKDRFQNGDAQVFVGQQQSGGIGITLTAASFVIYFSNTFSLEDRLQSEDRAHRIGQQEHVTYISLVAKSTIDEHVVRTLVSKKNVADEIVDHGMEMLK